VLHPFVLLSPVQSAMAHKSGAALPSWATPPTSSGSSTPRRLLSDLSCSDEDSNASTHAQPKPFSVAEAIHNMLLGTCYSTPSNDNTILVPLPPRRPSAQRCLSSGTLGQERVRYQFDRLEHLGTLGNGSFGSVTLVKCHVTDQTLALKAMSKGMILQNNMQQHVKNEKLAMQRSCSPFVIRLAACFNRDQHLYFLMEAATGGDLFSFYQKTQSWGSEVHARFYVACIASALSHLHERHIIYRDVKVENVVLDTRGYAKLCDFGLARFVEPSDDGAGSFRRSKAKAYTACGTPEYMAPETVGTRGYSFTADWWSLGVLAFGILTGKMPFNAKKVKDVLLKARAGIDRVKFPDGVDWPELVQGLCARDPYDRLPVREGGLRNLQELPWFRKSNFDWVAHGKCEMVAPYIPTVKGPNDECDSDLDEMEPPRDVLYKDPGSGWDVDFEDLVGPLCADMVGI